MPIPPVVLSEKGKGNWQLLGRLPDITEGQWNGIVEYRVYWSTLTKQFDGSATEAGITLLQANEVYFENKYAQTLQEAVNKSPRGDYESKLFEADVFREDQSKVWDREMTYLFIKID